MKSRSACKRAGDLPEPASSYTAACDQGLPRRRAAATRIRRNIPQELPGLMSTASNCSRSGSPWRSAGQQAVAADCKWPVKAQDERQLIRRLK